MLLFELEPEKIVKDGQHNEKLWRDGFVQAKLFVINDINIIDIVYGTDFKRVQPKIKTHLHDF
jgi:hypothetical protein